MIERQDRLLDRADPADAGRAAQAESQARRRTLATCSCRTSLPTCSSSWGTTASIASGLKMAARRSCTSAPITASYLTSGEANAETREYIKRKINSAQWLIESIEQRRNTLTRVAQAIVDHQTEFLNKGPESIEPLKMQQIADKVGVHVTTVSRAVDDKWIQTPRGIFPLKRFFCGGTVSADGEEVAWDAVRLKLQEIIDGENKQHPLQRRRTGEGTGQARADRRAADRDQISQGDEHPQLASAPRLEQPRRAAARQGGRRGRGVGKFSVGRDMFS